MPNSLQTHELPHQAPLSMEFFSKNTGVGCHFLPQGIFLTQGSNLSLLHWQANSSPMSQQGSPRLWVAMVKLEFDKVWKDAMERHYYTLQALRVRSSDRQTQISRSIPACPSPPELDHQLLPVDRSLQGTWSSTHLPNRPPSEKKHCCKWSLWFFKVWGWNSLCSEPYLSHPPPGCPLIMVNSSILNMKGHYLEPSGKLPGHMVTEGCGSGHTPWSALNLFSEEVMARDRKYFGQLFPQCTEALVGSTVVLPSVDGKLIYSCADKIFAKHWHWVAF